MDLNLGLPLSRAYDLPHCTGLGENLTEGLGRYAGHRVATIRFNSVLCKKWELITFAPLDPLEK